MLAGMDQRLDAAPVVARFAESVRPIAAVIGFYAGGSLAARDYQPGISDLDLVAIIEAELTAEQQRDLAEAHVQLTGAEKLHCVYAPQGALDDLGAEHLTWAHGELYRRAFSGIARAELLNGGIVVYGPDPAELIPAMGLAAIKEAAQSELSGYWRTATGKPQLWLQDVYVDLGLITLARVEATVQEGRLITKREAIDRLHRFGVSAELAWEIRQRRNGEQVRVGPAHRAQRAIDARRLMIDGISRLLS
jgi:hypothetical protein